MMYSHPKLTRQQRRIYGRWNAEQKRARRYFRIVHPIANVLLYDVGALVHRVALWVVS